MFQDSGSSTAFSVPAGQLRALGGVREDPLGLGEGVPGLGVGVRDDLVLGDALQVKPRQGDFERQRALLAAVDGEDGHGARPRVPYGGGVQQVRLAVLRCPVRRRVHPYVQDLAAPVPGCLGEGEEGGLPPGRPAWLGHDRRDHVDQLGEAGDGHPVRVPQQCDEQAAEDDGVGDAVVVLQQPGRLGPVERVLLRLLLEPLLVPDVPLVEGEVDPLRGLQARPDVVAGRDDALDEGLHVDGRGEEGVTVAVGLLVVGVQRDMVDEVVGLGQDRRLPRREGRHGAAGGAAGDELDRGVDLTHRARRLGREPPVLLGGLVAGLPGAVHLVAQAPQPDAEGVLVAVGGAQVGELGPGGVVGVLLELDGLLDAAGAEVDREHRFGLRADLPQEADVLGEAESIRLGGAPGEVELGRGRSSTGPTLSSQR